MVLRQYRALGKMVLFVLPFVVIQVLSIGFWATLGFLLLIVVGLIFYLILIASFRSPTGFVGSRRSPVG